MNNENLNEEIEDIVELTQEEGEETTGGAAGYGNVQYQCVCGKEYLTENKLAKHLASTRHPYATVWYQCVRGKSSRGTKIGNLKVKTVKEKGRGMSVYFTYPNGASPQYAFPKGAY